RGAHRGPTREDCFAAGRRDAVVVELPRPRLRVASDPRAERHARLDDVASPHRDVQLRLFELVRLDRVLLPVVAVRDLADLRVTGARAAIADRGVGRSRGQVAYDTSARDPAARPARHRRRLHLRVRTDARRLHRSVARGQHAVPRQRRVPERRRRQQRAVRRCVRARTRRHHGPVLARRAQAESVRSVMRTGPEPRSVRISVRIGVGLVLAFLFIPLVVIVLYAFNKSIAQSWPISTFSTKWFSVAWHNSDVRSALWTSVKAGAGAMTIALTLGSLAAFAIHRFKFFGRETVSFLLVLQ